MRYEQWWYDVHPHTNHAARKPLIDLEDERACSELVYRDGVHAASYLLRYFQAAVAGEPEPTVDELRFGSNDAMIDDMRASMSVGW
jgi:hypothetical protein